MSAPVHTVVDVTTPYGVMSLDRESDKKMLQVLERGVYPNDAIISLVQKFLTQTSVVVDIGAHVGTFSIPLTCARVIAFEPAPETFVLLERNVARAKGVFDLRNKGLSTTPGFASLVGRVASNAGAQTLAPGGDIEISTLDTEVEHVDFIKLDVEGMEESVLLGGKTRISTDKPTVIFEVNVSQLRAHRSSPKALERFFRQHGYKLFLPIEGLLGVSVAKIHNLSLLTAFIAPRAWFLRSDSAPFDVLAVHVDTTMPVAYSGFTAALVWALGNNIRSKIRRIRAYMRI